MDFTEVCAVFQGTIFYDDFHGDLKSISQDLDRRDSQTSSSGSPDDKASLLLLKTLWNMFAGDLKAADQHLSDLIEGSSETYGPRWEFRANAYRALLLTWREYPRLFRSCELSGPAIMTWAWQNARDSDIASAALALCRARSRRSEGISELDKIEFEVIQEVCVVDQQVRQIARRLNATSEDYDYHAGTRTTDGRLLLQSQNRLVNLQIRTLCLGLPAVSAYLSKTLYDLSHSQGDPLAFIHLENMRKTYTEMGDEAGIGLYWMIRGDHNLSPPFTSPLVLNFKIADTLDEFGGDSRVFHAANPYVLDTSVYRTRRRPARRGSVLSWRRIANRLKAARTRIATAVKRSVKAACGKGAERWKPRNLDEVHYLGRLSTARRCYAQAEAHFTSVSCARGSAASMLRTACSFIMEDMQASRFWSPGTRQGKVASLLGISRDLCRIAGDEQLGKLVDAHRLLARTHDDDHRSVGRSLGYGSEERNDEVFALCLALLSLRESFHYRYHLGAFTESRDSSEVSRQILKSMTIFRTLWYQVMLAQMSMMQPFGLNTPVVWADILKYQWHVVRKECLVRVGVEGGRSAASATLGYTLFQHSLKMAVGSIIPIDSAVGEPDEYPDNAVLEMLDIIHETYPEDNMTKDWIELQRIRIKYHKALIWHRRHVEMGELGNANRSLTGFLEDPQVLANNNLQCRAWIVDVAVKYGEPERGAAVMSKIHDADVIPRQYSGIGGSTVPTLQRTDAARRSLKSLEIIFLCCIRLSQWDRASRVLELLEVASPGYYTSVTSYSKLWPWQRCLYTGLVREAEGQYTLAFQYFVQAFGFVRQAQHSLHDYETVGARWEMADLSRLMEALTRRSIRWQKDLPVFGSTAEYGSSNHNDEGVLFLEAARTQIVSETAAPEKVAAQYKYQTWVRLRTKRRRTAAEEQEFERLNAEIDQFTAELTGRDTRDESPTALRSRGAAKQLSRPPFQFTPRELYASIPSDAIVIYITVSEDGLSVFAIADDGVKVADFNPKTTPAEVRTSVAMLWDLFQGNQDTDGVESFILQLVLRRLSKDIINPAVEQCIAARNHVIFVPSGPLTRLPFGALIFKGNYLLLQKQVSQVPRLSALRALSQRFDSRTSRPRITGDDGTIRIIARPGSVEDQSRTLHRPLHFAGIEAMVIAHLSGTSAIDADKVTRDGFQNYLRDAQILHLATHGYNDADYPFNSSIVLKERFRVIDMLAVRTQVTLVTFGACLGGLGRPSDLGDIDGFSHAVLAAGASTYLGALWEVDDFSTMMHMFLFYFMLFVVVKAPSIAEAWHFATRMLYELRVEDKVKILESMLSGWDVWEKRDEKPGEFVQRGKSRLRRVLARLRENSEAKEFDFKRPAVWAAFSLVGNGSIRVESSLYGTATELMGALGPVEGAVENGQGA
ncbi:CHAT domain-containing protein [Podospora aff. communis PSN243]|uniref:CHAT domain-containing protein n=1 Tax=Podospora aff. communis PSN243 TaxID=3040156 RepID=A0AAV9GB29_9PEZI|nr:CHAT domain-containing protein [Podospora aff. communis PSN243]